MKKTILKTLHSLLIAGTLIIVPTSCTSLPSPSTAHAVSAATVGTRQDAVKSALFTEGLRIAQRETYRNASYQSSPYISSAFNVLNTVMTQRPTN